MIDTTCEGLFGDEYFLCENCESLSKNLPKYYSSNVCDSFTDRRTARYAFFTKSSEFKSSSGRCGISYIWNEYSIHLPTIISPIVDKWICCNQIICVFSMDNIHQLDYSHVKKVAEFMILLLENRIYVWEGISFILQNSSVVIQPSHPCKICDFERNMMTDEVDEITAIKSSIDHMNNILQNISKGKIPDFKCEKKSTFLKHLSDISKYPLNYYC